MRSDAQLVQPSGGDAAVVGAHSAAQAACWGWLQVAPVLLPSASFSVQGEFGIVAACLRTYVHEHTGVGDKMHACTIILQPCM
jgi:hypothetical protein